MNQGGLEMISLNPVYQRVIYLIVVLMGLFAMPTHAATPACGSTLTKNTKLKSDMICPGTALYLTGKASKKITLKCDGHSIEVASGSGIFASNVTGVTIKDCVISTSDYFSHGIVLSGGSKNLLKDNTITTTGESSRGVELRDSDSNQIRSNTVNTTNTGSNAIRLRSGSDKNLVSDNTLITDASHAINIESSSKNKLYDNWLESPHGFVMQRNFHLQNGGLGIDDSGNIYAVDNNWGSSDGIGTATAFFRVDPLTGLAHTVKPLLVGTKDIGFGFGALDVLPNQRILAFAGFGAAGTLYEIDAGNGQVTSIALSLPGSMTGQPNGLEATSDTSLLATTNTGELLNINLNTKTVTEIGSQSIGWTDLASHPNNGKTYAVSRRRDEATGTAHLYEINVANGQIVTEIGDTGQFGLSSIDFAMDETLYGNSDAELIEIDITDASVTNIGGFGPDPLERLSRKTRLKDNWMQNADGSIRFDDSITIPAQIETNISTERVEILANQMMVDSAELPFLDEPARITFENLGGTYRNLLVDPEDDGSFVPCDPPQCKFISFLSGTLVFDVKEFTTYSSEENTDPTLEFVAATVLAEIKHLLDESKVSKNTKKKLKAASKTMNKARNFLKKGNVKKGLTEIGKTVASLSKVKAKVPAASTLIDRLAEASKSEAQAAIDAAIAAGGKQTLIHAAQAKMTAAQDNLNAGKADKAINSYRLAWDKAQKAIKAGGGSNTGGGTNTGLQLYQMLDDALAQKVVSATDPSGLWVFYGKGVSDLQFNMTGSSLLRDETINLFAFVVSVYVIDNLGTLQIALNNCTAEYNGNGLIQNTAVQGPNSFNQFTMDLQKLRQMAGTLYPFHPGDVLNDANYQAFLDTDFAVTLVNNSEMIFPADFTFTDGTGDSQGSFTASFKARKISDNFNDDLGDFIVNSVNRDSHCFEYLNQFNDEESSTTFQGQTTIIESDFMWEKFSIGSWPDSLDGMSSFLYQDRGAFTSVINGQPASVDPLTSVNLRNTANMFPGVSVFSALGSNMVDLIYNFSTNTGLTMDYSISNGVNTLTGKVEALY